MKKKQQHPHKRRPVANHRRKVHKLHGGLLLALWGLAAFITIFAVLGYIKLHSTVSTEKAGINLTVDGVKYDDVGGYPFKAPPGWKFLIAHVELKNNTDQIFNFAPVIQTYIKDSQNHKYFMSPITLNDPIQAGPVAAHQSVSGSLSYLVPINAKGVTLQLQL